MHTDNLAKIVFIGIEILSVYAVILLSYICEYDWMIATFISLFTLLAVCMQCEQQKIEWYSEEDEEEAMIQSYIDLKAEEGR